jgi:hypothetical protein
MKLRSLAVLFAFVAASAVAVRAQSAAYATFDAQQFTRNGILASPPSGSSNSDSPWLYGTTFGGYYTFPAIAFPHLFKLPTGPVKLGIDGRGTIVRTTGQYSRDEAIVSLRVTPKKPIGKFTPYVQGGAGLGHTKIPGQLNYTNNWNYVFGVGLDRKLSKLVDWRVFEVSGGFMSNYVAGSNVNNTNHLLDFATGIAIHFPSKTAAKP